MKICLLHHPTESLTWPLTAALSKIHLRAAIILRKQAWLYKNADDFLTSYRMSNDERKKGDWNERKEIGILPSSISDSSSRRTLFCFVHHLAFMTLTSLVIQYYYSNGPGGLPIGMTDGRDDWCNGNYCFYYFRSPRKTVIVSLQVRA